MGFQKLEMLQHRVIGRKAERSDDVWRLRLGLHTLELDAGSNLAQLDAFKAAVEIEMPPGTAEFAVGGEFETDFLLPADDGFDLAVFDLSELPRADLIHLACRARVLDRRAA